MSYGQTKIVIEAISREKTLGPLLQEHGEKMNKLKHLDIKIKLNKDEKMSYSNSDFLAFISAWIGSLSFAVSLACGPFAGSLVNRFGCRKVSITGCLTGALSLTIASFANDLAVLYVCYAVFGAGACCVYLSGLEIVRKCFDKRRSIALGIASAGLGLGTMSLSQVLQFLVTVLSWRNSLRIVAGGLALNSLSGLLYDSTIVETANDNEPLSSEEDGERRRSKRFMFHFSVWKVPGFLVLTFSFMFSLFGRAIVYVHLVSTP